MNILELLITVLCEEGIEVALAMSQRTTKGNRFSLDEIEPGQPFTNAERICKEMEDLNGVFEMIQVYRPDMKITREGIEAKKLKVEESFRISLANKALISLQDGTDE